MAPAVLAALTLACGEDRVTPTGPAPVPPTNPVPAPPAPLTNPGIAFASNRDGTWRIYVANRDGSAARPIAPGSSPSWSRDGAYLAFSGGPPGAEGFLFTGSPLGSVWSLTVRGYDPAWSPGGHRLTFATFGKGLLGSIEVIDEDGSQHYQLHSAVDYAYQPAWSPDGRRIAFAVGTYVDAHSGVWIINVDGSGLRQLGPLDSARPVWSPDGTRIAYSSNTGIWVSNENGSDAQLVIAGTNLRLGDWSLDGRQFLVARVTGAVPALSCRIYAIDVGRGVEQQLVPDADAPASPTYCDTQPVWAQR